MSEGGIEKCGTDFERGGQAMQKQACLFPPKDPHESMALFKRSTRVHGIDWHCSKDPHESMALLLDRLCQLHHFQASSKLHPIASFSSPFLATCTPLAIESRTWHCDSPRTNTIAGHRLDRIQWHAQLLQ